MADKAIYRTVVVHVDLMVKFEDSESPKDNWEEPISMDELEDLRYRIEDEVHAGNFSVVSIGEPYDANEVKEPSKEDPDVLREGRAVMDRFDDHDPVKE